jgi:predicted membrane protein
VVSDDIRSVDPIISAMHLAVLISFSVSMFVFGVVSIEVWETQLPIWGFVLALCIGVFI